MSGQLPIKSSSFTSVIREVLKVRTKGSLAGVNLLMIAVVFPVVLFLGTSMTYPQMGVIITLFITWQAFALYAMRQLPSYDAPSDNTPKQKDVLSSTTEVIEPKGRRLKKEQ